MEKASFPPQSDVLDNTHYGFSARFENGLGTNPGELIRAAHADCFTIAISAQLGEANMIAKSVTTNAAVTQEKIGDEFSITAIYLKLIAKIREQLTRLSNMHQTKRRWDAQFLNCSMQKSRWMHNWKRKAQVRETRGINEKIVLCNVAHEQG